MNPTYKVGDIVQIISEEEVRSHPADVCGDFILTHFLSGADDLFQREKLLLLPAFPKAMKGTYTISPLSSLKIEPFLTGMTGFSPPLNFTLVSFLRPRFLPCPSMIC
jgi:hypothetical protein